MRKGGLIVLCAGCVRARACWVYAYCVPFPCGCVVWVDVHQQNAAVTHHSNNTISFFFLPFFSQCQWELICTRVV